MLNGIDVSAAGQGPAFPWHEWKGRIQFAGVKISESTNFADPAAAANIAGARAIGCTVIGYHFLHASLSGSGQAEWFLKCAKAAGLHAGDLAAMDAEDGGLDGESASQMDVTGATFRAQIQRHFPGYNPVCYTERSMAPSLLSLGQCPPWIANPDGVKFTSIGPWKVIAFEQVGQRGVDTDVFYGDLPALRKLAIPK